MSPTLYEVSPDGKARFAWLVDEHSAVLAPDEKGITRRHFRAAIELGALRASELFVVTDPATGARTLHPPCCYVMRVDWFRGEKRKITNDIRARGFDSQAARVLLELAAAASNAAFYNDKWEFRAPAAKGTPQPWSDEKFLAAWRWSYWQHAKLTGEQRHADMVALGYPHTAGALRKMLSTIGLVSRRRAGE